MTDNSPDQSLEAELEAALHRVADAVPVVDEPASTVVVSPGGRRSHRLPLAAAAAILAVVVGIAAFVIANRNDTNSETVATDLAAGEETTEEPAVEAQASEGTEAGTEDGNAAATVDTSLDGTYLLLAGTVDGVDVPIVEGAEPTLVINGEEWGGRAACNGYGLNVAIGAAGSLAVQTSSSDEALCEAALMDTEVAYLAGLATVTGIDIDLGVLTLFGDGVELVFDRQPTSGEAGTDAFTDVDWLLVGFVEGGVEKNVVEGEWLLQLGRDGSFHAESSCLGLNGAYVFDGVELMGTNIAADHAAACQGSSSLNDLFIAAMESSRLSVVRDGEALALAQGADALLFVRGNPTQERLPPPDRSPADFGLSSVVAVTDDLELVQLSADGTSIENRVEMADLIPGILHVEGVAYDANVEASYVSVRRSGGDTLDCIGSIVLVDWTGGARGVADGRLAVLSFDDSKLAYTETVDTGDGCRFTAVKLLDIATSNVTTVELDSPVIAGPDSNLAWWPDESALVLSSDETTVTIPIAGSTPDLEPDIRMATPTRDGVVGQVGCCAAPMPLGRIIGPTEFIQGPNPLVAPIVTIRAIDLTVVIVDAAGTLLAAGPDLAITALGEGFLAADGEPA